MQEMVGLFLVMAQVISDGAQSAEIGGGAIVDRVGAGDPRSAVRPHGVLHAAC
jgi:hypothetical protein